MSIKDELEIHKKKLATLICEEDRLSAQISELDEKMNALQDEFYLHDKAIKHCREDIAKMERYLEESNNDK